MKVAKKINTQMRIKLRIKDLKIIRDCSAQATVEYLIVGLALLAVISGLSVFGGRIQEGLFSEHAADSASHAMTSNSAGSIGDFLLY